VRKKHRIPDKSSSDAREKQQEDSAKKESHIAI
jgi:hypothetical protein